MTVRATLVRVDMEPGWRIVGDHVTLGKEYWVDTSQIQTMTLLRLSDGHGVPVDCIWVVSPGRPGWLPLLCFKLDES